jgi:hypothetical protein
LNMASISCGLCLEFDLVFFDIVSSFVIKPGILNRGASTDIPRRRLFTLAYRGQTTLRRSTGDRRVCSLSRRTDPESLAAALAAFGETDTDLTAECDATAHFGWGQPGSTSAGLPKRGVEHEWEFALHTHSLLNPDLFIAPYAARRSLHEVR